ncbi:MAG: nucleoid occlusion factor SlmA [Gammaproteobacteria bacterium]|nr:nucleoid occlusion factor SlmA [Gammaproteobacteria bacterium]NIM72490.1 nucleoid occlusion factor SlmA [Gammaproteobacteria bacterium]NIO24249.1 nucleoid occlusion factor SlmA [Gammaproteobacteria bacterium]NIO64854.1 nucleoid occlusion factor SlmA [Gammaproteobacteria bacterium]NIP44895.1 nucleoid occlusion factor SlmA [Gammaproteobacteria bacterium]
MPEAAKPSRRQQILEALARELETHPGMRITTARLAEVVGVSEAALYRHFPSKAKMFEALIEFSEESVFGLANRILGEESQAAKRCERILAMLLTFSDRNPGITRVLLGEALVGEHERLRARVAQFFSRFETQLKQVLREGEQAKELDMRASVSAIANLLMAVVEGRMTQFSRSGFANSPLESWEQQWRVLHAGLFPHSDG